jgi:YidC/Oxa1 family membrane protein insertase
MVFLYQIIFYQPILNALVFLYNTIAFNDFGIAIILITLIIRLLLYPLFHKSSHQNMMMQRLQPKIKEIQEIHKDNKEKQSKALMELYKENGVNPFSGFLFLLIQIPILIALYQIIQSNLSVSELTHLYSFIQAPNHINDMFLGFINLSDKNITFVLLAAIAQYFQSKLAIYKIKGVEPSQTQKMANQMAFIGPLLTIFIFYNFPGAIALYWLSSSVFSIFQQLIINKKLRDKYGD